MGIQGLMKLLSEECPGAIKEQEMENYTGRKIAIDASMAMYQFLVAVRSNGPGGMQASAQLMNDNGDVTSHIQGMFNRTIKIMSSGIKPVYVFDGKPPQMKGGELAKRMARRAKAETDLAAAKESGEQDDVDRFSRRLVKVTRQHNEECKELLTLMGVPYVDAPCEAEAQCAELAKKKKVFATATEDMDALTFRTPKLVRKLTFSQGKDKQPIIEIDMESVLIGLELTYEQFVDLCILCGCDYCNSIKGVGPKTALKLIKQHKSLEKIIEALRKEKKYDIPADWKVQKFSKKALAEAEAAEAAAKVEAEARAKARAEAAAMEAASISETLNKRSEEALGNAAASVDQPVEEAAASVSAEVSTVEVKVNTAVDDGLVDTDDEADIVVPEVDEEGNEDLPEGADISASSSAVVDDSDEVVMSELQGDDDEYEIVEPVYVQARKLFVQSEVHDGDKLDLKWSEPNEEALKKFLVERMGFNSERVTSGIARLKTANQQKSQKRMDSFFSVVAAPTAAGIKRKVEDPKGKPGAKKGPGGAKGGPMKRK